MSREKGSSNFGVLIIIIGVAILLANLNVLNFSMFWGIVKLWPFLLIIAGLGIIFKRVRYINVILWLGFIGVVIAYSYLNIDDKTWFFGDSAENIETVKIINSLDEGIITLDIHHGNIDIDSDGEKLIYDIPTIGIDEVTFEESLQGPFELTIVDGEFEDIFLNVQSRNYNITLPEEGKWLLNVNGGAISADFDFRKTPLTGLNVDFGVGDIDLFVSELSEGQFDINVGVGDIELNIPDGVGVLLTSNGGLVSIEVPNSYKESDGVYRSKNYDDAEYKIEILLDIGVGTFQIK